MSDELREALDQAVKDKALWMSKRVIGIQGAPAFFRDLIGHVLGEPCPYCGRALALDNLALDHKTPVGKRSTRREGRKGTEDERKAADDPSNLQIVCSTCNQRKGDLSDEQYCDLLHALDGVDAGTRDYVLRRLGQAAAVFRYRGRRGGGRF